MSAIEKDLSIGATTAQSLSSRFLSQFSQGGCNHMFGKSTIVIALISFKAAPLLFYFFANFFTSSFIAQFLVIFTLLSMDFWIVKNIRFLIDLRWWNFVDADGNDNWKFKSAKDMTQLPAIDRRIFWIGLVVGPAAWTVFVVTAFLTFEFEWMIVALLGALVNLANLWRYLSCHWNHTEQTTKDDKIPMTSLEACKENIKRKFAQDRNALLAFIQYEVAQGESIEDSYKRFCRAFGEDAMKYLDFDFWFYRFMNGQFDLDHDRSKDPVLSELSKMPRELSEKIFGYLDWKDRSTVRKVSRTLRSVVDNSKQYIDKLRLIIECGECTLEVDDQKYSRCINYDHPFPDARIMMALDNLLPILKLPRVEIKRLLISFYYGNQQIVNQFTETLKDAFFTLKQHKVSVKTLEFNVNSQVEVLAEVLPYFKPVVLEEIELVNGGARDGPNIDDLVELEQWKKASTRRAKYVVCSKIESLFHLTDFNAQIPTLTMDDFVRLRETLQASTNFESGTLKLADLVSAENIRNELGNRNVRFDDGFTIQFWNRNNQFYFFKKHRDFGSW